MEIKTGLLQLCEALAFLHADARLLHRNINPNAVVINKEGGWKLLGFEYCAPANTSLHADAIAWTFRPYHSNAVPLLQPQLDYLAPEHICAEANEPASDLYSLAILIYALHSPDHQPPHRHRDSIDSFRRAATDLEHGAYPNLACVPAQLADHVRLSLNARPGQRPDVHALARTAYADDERVHTLQHLDSATQQWTQKQKAQFYKNLPAVLAEMPARVQRQHVLPALQREFGTPAMIPFVLPAHFHIAGECTRDEYAELVLEPLRPVLRMHEPIQILLILVQHIELLLRQTPQAALQSDVLPMLYRALETDQPQMQQMCLSVLPAFAGSVDRTTVKMGILPRIRTLCTAATTAPALVVNGLACVGHLLEHMDRWMVLDEVVVALLLQVKRREPRVIVAVVEVLRRVWSEQRLGMTKEVMAGKVVPFLMPLCVENGLALAEFELVVALLKDVIGQVEREQRGKLEQVASVAVGAAGTASSAMSNRATIRTDVDVPRAILSPTTTPANKSPHDWARDFMASTSKTTPPTAAMKRATIAAPNYNITTPMTSTSNISPRSLASPLSPPPTSFAFSPSSTANTPTTFPKSSSSISGGWAQSPNSQSAAKTLPMNAMSNAITVSGSGTMPMMWPTVKNGNGAATKAPANSGLTQQDILDFLK